MRKYIVFFVAAMGVAFCHDATSVKSYDHYFPVDVLMPTQASQDAFDYLPSGFSPTQPLLTPAQAQQKRRQFLRRYFFPWSPEDRQMTLYVTGDNTIPGMVKDIYAIEEKVITKCQSSACYDANYLPFHKVPDAIVANMDLAHLPNVSCLGEDGECLGIMVKNAMVRDLPTEQPFFASPTQPGEGYPFDYMQDGDLWLGTPVKVIQHSSDNQWLLVKGQGMLGWVKRHAVAHATADFRNRLQHIEHFMTPMQRRTTFYDTHSAFGEHGLRIYLGSIFPMLERETKSSTIGIPEADSKGDAVLKPLTVLNSQFFPFPLQTTPAHFSLLINQMINMPYGWGGLGFNSDCSGTLTRIFSAFGIWLTPSSKIQGQFGGKIYPIPEQNRKKWLIQNKGQTRLIPYLTLITLGHKPDHISHVMLYLGRHIINGQPHAMVFHEPWGLRIDEKIKDGKGSNPVGRAIYGRAVIASIGIKQLQTMFQDKGLLLGSLWNSPSFNVTLLNQPPQPRPAFFESEEILLR